MMSDYAIDKQQEKWEEQDLKYREQNIQKPYIGVRYDEDRKESIRIHNERVLSLGEWDRNPLE